MILRHLHLPGLTRYTQASALQDKLVSALLRHKANAKDIPAPEPTIITAQFRPVYTCGRREVGTISPQQVDYLTSETILGRASFHEALRGGQTTFHGPGQLIAYPILDLRRHAISPRCYIHMLEASVMATCAQYGVRAMRTENPGVWVSEQDKICAVGVHLRRNVSSHGIGLNVSTDLRWFGRIVACGLEGKGTTNLREMGVEPVPAVDEVAMVFAKQFATHLQGIDEIKQVNEADVN